MKITTALVALLLMIISAHAFAAGSKRKDSLCDNLQAFLASVRPDEKRAITLYTFWGAREESDKIVMGSKHCEHSDYEPGKKLCDYLMDNSSTEFPGYNVKRVLSCFAPRPGLPKDLDINSGSFSTRYGSPNRGALVDIDLYPDKESDDMAFRLVADGY